MCTLDDFCHWLTTKKDWCCYIALIVVTVIFTIFFVKMGLLDSFWNLLICFIDNAIEVVECEALAIWITAVATSTAAFFAYRAYKQSQKTRKNAVFSTLFAQLLANHKSIFENKELIISNPRTGKEESAFALFFNYCKDKISSNTSESIDSYFIRELYDNFPKEQGNNVHFSHCFKYVYYEIKTVLDEKCLDKDDNNNERGHYMGVIQACMNYDELFSYFINLLQYFSKKDTWGVDDENFLKGIRNYDFFKNLMEGHDDKYKKQIEKLYNKSSNDKSHKIQKVIEDIIKKDYFLQ